MYHLLRPILFGLAIFFAVSPWLLPGQAQHVARTASLSAASVPSKSLDQNGVQAQVLQKAARGQQSDQAEFEASAGGGGLRSIGDTAARVEPAAEADSRRIRSTGAAGAPFPFAAGPHTESGGLVINATFDSSITSNPNSAAIEAMINQAIGLYQSQFSDPITVSILFRYSTTAPNGTPLSGGLLARSNYVIYNIPWTTFTAALIADSKTANDLAANASLPVAPLSTNVISSSANGRALGLNTPPAVFADGHVGAGGPFDGIVTINSNQAFLFSRNGGIDPGHFDAQRSTEHEIDEVLGFGSFLDISGGTNVRPQDLFSWSSSGVRNVTTGGARYFSINNGVTDIIGFNQTPGNDFGDWLSGPCPQTTPFVQNAISCRGQFSDVSAASPEGINLDVIGYDLSSSCGYSIMPTSQSFQAAGGAGTINVTTAANCTWTASSNLPWVTITSGSTGSGSGVIGYSVAPNNSADPRSGMLFAAGQSFAVSQAGGGAGLVQLSVDDGSFEFGTTLSGTSTVFGVNRFTPDHYPATLSQVQIFFGSQFGLSAGQGITLLVGTTAGNSAGIDGTSFQSSSVNIGTLGAFNTYNVPNVTINSGDFVVGFRMATVANVFPIAEDTNAQPQRRSYISGDGSSFVLIDDILGANAGNFGIRAGVSEPAGGTTPSVANLSGDLEGRVLTLTGTAFDGGADMTGYEITLRDLNNATIGDTGVQPINFGSSTASYFTLQINNMNTFPAAVTATVVIIDGQGNRSPLTFVTFGDSDPGGPGLVNMGLSDGVLTIKGGPFVGNLQLEVNGDIEAPPLKIKVKGGGSKLKIAGPTMGSGPNRVRILADKFKSNIFVFFP